MRRSQRLAPPGPVVVDAWGVSRNTAAVLVLQDPRHFLSASELCGNGGGRHSRFDRGPDPGPGLIELAGSCTRHGQAADHGKVTRLQQQSGTEHCLGVCESVLRGILLREARDGEE